MDNYSWISSISKIFFYFLVFISFDGLTFSNLHRNSAIAAESASNIAQANRILTQNNNQRLEYQQRQLIERQQEFRQQYRQQWQEQQRQWKNQQIDRQQENRELRRQNRNRTLRQNYIRMQQEQNRHRRQLIIKPH